MADRFVGEWEVVRQIRNDPASPKDRGRDEISAASIIKRVMPDDFRIIHLAGHGIYDRETPLASGMVLGANVHYPWGAYVDTDITILEELRCLQQGKD